MWKGFKKKEIRVTISKILRICPLLSGPTVKHTQTLKIEIEVIEIEVDCMKSRFTGQKMQN